MAKEQENSKLQSTSQTDTDIFVKGMIKDTNTSLVGKEQWTHARNAINNSDRGDVGTLGNEPANLHCVQIPYTVIGAIHLYGDKWVVFSTDDMNAEIGTFDDSECKYETLVNDGSGAACPPENCLNFRKQNLITGAAKENFDCTWQVYWDDGRNPSRTLNIDRPAWKTQKIVDDDCITYVPIEPKQIDCELIRLAPLLDTPRVTLNKADDGGQLRNGSYQAFIAYCINEQTIGDWIGVSNVQALYEHEDMGGSLHIEFADLDKGEFEYFKLVIASNNQSEIQAKAIGFYSTETTEVSIDYIDQKLEAVPIEYLPLRNPAYEKSDHMYVVNDYLIRQGPKEQFDFNYQPFANEIRSRWVVTQFPADYYAKGGNKATFMRDEVYSFFIRWIYNTGEKSSSYHIPGPAKENFDQVGGFSVDELAPSGDANTLSTEEKVFQVYNTAGLNTDGYSDVSPNTYITNDGGWIRYNGGMAYWESTETYPHKPEVWGDLCGKPIRHHKFPEESYSPAGGFMDRSSNNNQSINILGVRFDNIALPRANPTREGLCDAIVEEEGEILSNIVGYEILVGSRMGHKSILAKGIARNMRGYALPADATGNESEDDMQGVMPNYPYNDLGSDPFLHNPNGGGDPEYPYQTAGGGSGGVRYGSGWTRADCMTFHSPDTSINRPFLNPYEIKNYGATAGKSIGIFKVSEKHPQEKLIKNICAIIAIVIGAGYAIGQTRGKKQVKFDYPMPRVDSVAAAPWSGWAVAGGNVGAMAIQQGAGIVTESIHTVSSVVGAPKLGGEVARGLNTAAAYPSQVAMFGGYEAGGQQTSYDSNGSWFSELPGLLQPFYGVFAFMQSTAEGGNHIIELIYNLVSYQDYALKYNSHGLYYHTMQHGNGAVIRSRVEKARYVKNTMQMLTSDIKVNNLFRPNTVAVKTEGNSLTMPPAGLDNSRYTVGDVNGWGRFTRPRVRGIAANYVGLKFNFENQYGQLDQIKQIPITNGEFGTGVQLIKNHWEDTLDENTRLSSVALYGGDCYLSRYTEKVIMPLFWDFLLGQPDGFPYDYRLRSNVPYPMYWANFQKYDLSNLARWITSFSWLESGSAAESSVMPNFFHHLDRSTTSTVSDGWGNVGVTSQGGGVGGINTPGDFDDNPGDSYSTGGGSFWSSLTGDESGCDDCDTDFADGNEVGDDLTEYGISGGGAPQQTGASFQGSGPDGSGESLFHIKNGYFYTHVNGINDFFVETEINVALRDYEDSLGKRHYDWLEFTDVNELFTAEIEAAGNFYKYDESLGVSKFFSKMISWGMIQPRDYDPKVAEECHTHYPKRLIYSLQAQKEAKKDFWRVFLANNYKDFKNKVNVIKPISKSGAVILFPHLAPVMFQGVDTLQTDLGTKLTIGDGGLFSQPMQNVTNADLSHEYGSCESSRSVVNTPSGLFYISQQQGKIFQLGQGLTNIANNGMKEWFNQYLPSKLLAQFPEMEHCNTWVDNPLAGVGCQSVYDPNYDIVYFCKKDYICNDPDCIVYKPCEGFFFNNTACGGAPVQYCCPDGYAWDGETCYNSTTVAATWEPDPSNKNCEFDIVLSLDASASVQGQNSTKIRNFMVGLADAFATEMIEGDVQMAVVTWDNALRLEMDWTSDINTVEEFAFGTGPPYGYYSGYLSQNNPDGTNPSLGFWYGLEKLYGSGCVPNRKKILVFVTDGYDSSCMNTPSTGSCNSNYQGFNSPSSNANPTTPEMRDIISVNPDSPGDPYYLQQLGAGNIPGQTSLVSNPPCCSPTASNIPDNFLSWVNSNVFNNDEYTDSSNSNFNGELSVWGIWFTPFTYQSPYYDGTIMSVAPTDQNYVNARSHPGQGMATGSLSDELVDSMVENIRSAECPIEGEYVCPPGCGEPYENSAGQWLCQCDDEVEGEPIETLTPITFGDPQYFTDVSWTVSYDPKSQAWISFHDWHPELTLPSLNHFLTTWSYPVDEGYCPPGFTFDTETGQCFQPVSGEFPGTVQIYEDTMDVDENWGSSSILCAMDVAFSLDVSGSADPDGGTSSLYWNQLAFVDAFIEEVEDEMDDGIVQIAVGFWSSNMQGTGLIDTDRCKTLTTDHNMLRAWLGIEGGGDWLNKGEDDWIWSGSGTDYLDCTTMAKRLLDKIITDPAASGSYLGDRTSDPNFTRYAILCTDSNDSGRNTAFEISLGGGMTAGEVMDKYFWRTGEDGWYKAASESDSGAYSDIQSFANEYSSSGNGNLDEPVPGISQYNIKTIAVKAANGNYTDGYMDSMSTFCQLFYDNGCYGSIDNGTQELSDLRADDDTPLTDLSTPRQSYFTNSDTFNDTAVAITSGLCSVATDGPDICRCLDPDFTLVYRNPSTGYYTEPTGVCEDGAKCVRSECYCDPAMGPGVGVDNITLLGSCPSIWDAMDGNFNPSDLNDNPDPLRCVYDINCYIPASYERGSFWKHNMRCDLFANYYWQDYPWEVEFVESLGQTVNTVRSVEYQQESYLYKGNLPNNCGDRFHDLDWNFDEAIIYNTEQVSGLLKLNLNPKNNIPLLTQYPIINASDIDILYSKEEQKYRFNQFWDITNDRGEFNPVVNNSIFITQLNGYIRDLNTQNLNYNKAQLQRKKFRHYWNKVILRKNVSGDRKMIMKLANTKLNLSIR